MNYRRDEKFMGKTRVMNDAIFSVEYSILKSTRDVLVENFKPQRVT